MQKSTPWTFILTGTVIAFMIVGCYVQGAYGGRDQQYIGGNVIICDHRTPISSLPYTIDLPGSYFLTGNLIGSSGSHGITITADDVTIDLNGFTVTGVPGSLHGIRSSGSIANVSIRDGSVVGWERDGVNLNTATDAKLRGITAAANTLKGFTVTDATLDACTARGNGDDGFAGEGSTFRRCRAIDNTSWGFDVDSSVVEDCTVLDTQGGGNGIVLDGDACIARDCRVNLASPTFSPITLLLVSEGLVERNTILGGTRSIEFIDAQSTRCTVMRNVMDGVIFVNGVDHRIAPTETADTSTNPNANLQF